MRLGFIVLPGTTEPGDSYYWIGDDDNAWSAVKYSEAQAEALSKTLHQCFNCVDCEECERCRSCIDCSMCVNCSESDLCRNCDDVHGSSECYSCSRCVDCLKCNGCADCGGGRFIDGPKWNMGY